MYSIGEIISTYRKKKGLLQQDLADELAKEGITISYKAISNWERNLAEPSVTIFYIEGHGHGGKHYFYGNLLPGAGRRNRRRDSSSGQM